MTLSHIDLDRPAVEGGDSTGARAVLSGPAPSGGTTVTLSSTHPAATVPASIVVPAGAAFGTFTVSTEGVALPAESRIVGAAADEERHALLHIAPRPAPPGLLASVAATPSALTGGGSATGTVHLTRGAPAPGVAVVLSSSSSAAIVPRTVVVPAGTDRVTFPVTTHPVVSLTTATITALVGTDQRAVSLTLEPVPLETFFSYVSQPGDFIGLGGSGRLQPPAATIAADALCSQDWIYISIRSSTAPTWTLEFSAPRGQRLLPGAYADVQKDIRHQSRPGMRISGNVHGCTTVSGVFTVTDAVYGSSGQVERFRATFEQRCNGSEAVLVGEISLSSVPPANLMTGCL